MKPIHEKAQREFKDEFGEERWVLFGASFDCCGDVQVGCLTREVSVFGEVTKHCLFGPFPVCVSRRSLEHSIYISSLCEQGSRSQGGRGIYTCKLFPREFIENSLQFNNCWTVFSVTVDTVEVLLRATCPQPLRGSQFGGCPAQLWST